MYNNYKSSNHSSFVFKHNTSSSSPVSSSSTGSGSTATSNIMSSNSTMFQSSSALSRNPRLYTRRYDSSSGRKSPVISGKSSSPTRKPSRTRSDSTDTGMHPAARALNKRASSMERMYPVRSAGPHMSKTSSHDSTSPESRSSYNRSLSVDRYGRTPDTRRFSSSVDYSTRLGFGSSSERLDHTGEDVNAHRNDYKHSSGLQSTREMSGSSSNMYHQKHNKERQQNGGSTSSSRLYSSDEVDKIRNHYNQEIQDLKLDYQSRLLAKDREWDKKLQASKSEYTNSQKLVMELRQRCNDMAAEYDKSMTELLNDKEQTTQSCIEPTAENMNALRTERDQYAEDLQLVEKSFTELHKRYDKLRETLQSQKRNEEKLKQELTDVRQQLRNSSQNFEQLRVESQEKLTRAANEVEKAKSSCKAELIRLQMALKKSEVHAQSIEQQLKQKIEENSELAQICDNLIALKGGGNNE